MRIGISSPPNSSAALTQDPSLSAWVRKAGEIIKRADNPRTIPATSGGESATIVQVGALIFYSYTGLGGVSFSYNGANFSIPVSAAPATVSSFVILEA